MIKLGEYLPDQPDLNNPGCTNAENVIPGPLGYRPFPSAVVFSDALTSAPQGAIIVKDLSGTPYHYAGDTAKLYALSVTAWTDVSRASGYGLASDEQWSFTQFNNLILASNYTDLLQQLTIGNTTFADQTDAPKMKYIATIGTQVVGGYVNDSTGEHSNRIQWSAFNDALDWPTPGTVDAISKQSGRQDLPDGGAIRNIVGGEYGVIIQDNAIQRMVVEGPPTFFGFYPIEKGRGTPAPYSVVARGQFVFYLAHDGFKMFDGQTSHSIGAEKVDRTLNAEIDKQYYIKVSAVIHPTENIVMWAVPVTGHTLGVPNKIYCYNWNTNQWSYITDTVELLVVSASQAITLEDLDGLYGTLENIPVSLDSVQFQGGAPQLSAFKTDKKLYNFNGTGMTATFETKEVEINPGHFTEVQTTEPIVDGGTTTVTVGTRKIQSASNSYGSAVALNSDGESEHRDEDRYHRFKMIVTGGFKNAQGINVKESVQTGHG